MHTHKQFSAFQGPSRKDAWSFADFHESLWDTSSLWQSCCCHCWYSHTIGAVLLWATWCQNCSIIIKWHKQMNWNQDTVLISFKVTLSKVEKLCWRLQHNYFPLNIRHQNLHQDFNEVLVSHLIRGIGRGLLNYPRLQAA